MNTAQLILLNGTSSSGKSTLLKELEKYSEERYKIIKIDDYFPHELREKARELGWNSHLEIDPWSYLHHYLYQTTGKVYFDTEVRQMLFNGETLYRDISNLVSNNQNVIFDTVLEYEDDYNQFFKATENIKVLKMLVYCPLDVLLKRVQMRNQSSNSQDHRSAFLSFEQFPAMYKLKDNDSEKIADVVSSAVLIKSLDQAIEELIQVGIPEIYLPKLDAFRKKFLRMFKLDELDAITLTATHSYDLILNSGNSTANELAIKISEFI